MSLVDNSWETDSEGERGPPEEYFRLKYDNVTKVKFQLKKIVNFI